MLGDGECCDEDKLTSLRSESSRISLVLADIRLDASCIARAHGYLLAFDVLECSVRSHGLAIWKCIIAFRGSAYLSRMSAPAAPGSRWIDFGALCNGIGVRGSPSAKRGTVDRATFP